MEMPVDRHPLPLLPTLDRSHVAIEVGRDLFPGIQPTLLCLCGRRFARERLAHGVVQDWSARLTDRGRVMIVACPDRHGNTRHLKASAPTDAVAAFYRLTRSPGDPIVSRRFRMRRQETEVRMQRALSKSAWCIAAIASLALCLTQPAMATDPSRFTSTTVAKGQFDEFDVFNIVKVPAQSPPPKNTYWRSRQRTKGLSDGAVFSNVWAPGGTTGWHTHPGHTLIFVTAGAVTQYQADDPTCTPHVYTAGMSFVDHGGSAIHIVRNEGTVEADAIAIRLVPAGQPGRIDVPDPGNCHFPN